MNALEKIKKYIDNSKSEEKISQGELANIVGVSRQRIAQLIELNGLEDVIRNREERKCVVCGNRMGKKFGKYCSDDCKIKFRTDKFYVTLKCASCKTEFTIKKSEYKARLRNKVGDTFFCSKKCQGTELGKTYGFGNRN